MAAEPEFESAQRAIMNRISPNRLTIRSIAVGLTAVTLLGCGSGNSDPDSTRPETAQPDATSNAADSTATADSSDTSLEQDSDTDAMQQTLRDAAEETRQLESGEIDYTLELNADTFGDLALAIDANVVSVENYVADAHASTKQYGAKLEADIISDGTTGWFRFTSDGELPLPVPADTWVTGTVEQLTDADILQPLEDSFTPLDLVYGVTNIGVPEPDNVNGVDADRYEVTIELADAVENVPPERRTALESFVSVEGNDGPVVFEGHVWIDEAGQIVKIDLEATGQFENDQGDYEVSIGVDLSSINETIELTEPPNPDEHDILDLDEVF